MSEPVIGDWIRRYSQKWHRVESVIAGDAITKCGRRMDQRTDAGELVIAVIVPLTRAIGQPQLCRLCYRDGST